ncbi:hypothetical protein [Nitrosomonas sp.]|uniref:hypothetical protein n=1 Tax=Nitrosomonas sp. TaxID=42353 RepID=UPI0025FE57D0|nr:hypothetical protein [Nitrosomonas sp.]
MKINEIIPQALPSMKANAHLNIVRCLLTPIVARQNLAPVKSALLKSQLFN